MSTLILEDLNLVTLNELLQRLPRETLVGELIEIIGERELFLPDQAIRIISHLSKVSEEEPHTVEKEIANLKELVLSQCKGENLGFEIKLNGILPSHINQTHRLTFEVRDGQVSIYGSNPTIGRSFWPELNEIIVAAHEEQKLHYIRERIVAQFAKVF